MNIYLIIILSIIVLSLGFFAYEIITAKKVDNTDEISDIDTDFGVFGKAKKSDKG